MPLANCIVPQSLAVKASMYWQSCDLRFRAVMPSLSLCDSRLQPWPTFCTIPNFVSCVDFELWFVLAKGKEKWVSFHKKLIELISSLSAVANLAVFQRRTEAD